MSQVLSIGSLTLDLFFQDRSLTIKASRFHLALGGKYVVGSFRQGIGGGGGNVAVGLSRLGIKTALWAQIGKGGVSKLILDRLEEEKVMTDFLSMSEEFTNLSVILLSEKGERTIINHRSCESQLSLTEKHCQLLASCQFVYLGNLPEVPLEERLKMLTLAKQAKTITFVNLGVKDCRQGLRKLKPLFSQTDYLLVNRYELSDILSIPANELAPNMINYVEKLFDNPNSTLIITDGEFGSYAQTATNIISQRAYKVEKLIDATGAGDAFSSGFISGIVYKKELKDCLRYGAKNSASVIAKINAQDGLLYQAQLFA